MSEKSQDLYNVLIDSKSKKACLEAIAESAATALSIDENKILSALSERERMGSTGLGNGLAIPHARLDALHQSMIIWTTTAQPIAFDAMDDQPVSVLITLLVPTGETESHLNTLGRLAKTFQDPAAIEKMHQCKNESEMKALIDSFGLADL